MLALVFSPFPVLPVLWSRVFGGFGFLGFLGFGVFLWGLAFAVA